MQQQPLRVVMSRDGSDASQEDIRDVHGIIFRAPDIGEPVQIYFDNGRYLITSNVKRVVQNDDEMIVETANSTYHLHLVTN